MAGAMAGLSGLSGPLDLSRLTGLRWHGRRVEDGWLLREDDF
jgi:hypothetical protein